MVWLGPVLHGRSDVGQLVSGRDPTGSVPPVSIVTLAAVRLDGRHVRPAAGEHLPQTVTVAA